MDKPKSAEERAEGYANDITEGLTGTDRVISKYTHKNAFIDGRADFIENELPRILKEARIMKMDGDTGILDFVHSNEEIIEKAKGGEG